MRKLQVAAWMMVLALASGVAARAQELSKAEVDKAQQYFESTKKNIQEATRGLSDAQWNFKPAPDRWSVAEVMEHVAAAEDLLRGMVQQQLMKAPPEPGRDFKKNDDAVMTMVPDRTHKAQAPEPLLPRNRFGSPDGSLRHFLESRTATEEYLKSASGLRDHVMDSQLGMKLDGYEFMLLIAAHSERHTKQILEVKADSSFPKK
jgi:hypothetical protein